jgi:peptidoglycan hydrolase CwlO-like protein
MPWTSTDKITAAGVAVTLGIAALGGLYYLGSEVGKSACSNLEREFTQLKEIRGKIDFQTFLEGLNKASDGLSQKLQQLGKFDQYEHTITDLQAQIQNDRSEIEKRDEQIQNLPIYRIGCKISN